MGILRSIESRIERAVEGSFGRVFSTNVLPVELARKLVKELEDGKVVSVSRTYAPNSYTVYLHPRDRERFSEYEASLRAELAVYLAEHARREGYTLPTRPRVVFETESALSPGTFGISTELLQDGVAADGAPIEEPALLPASAEEVLAGAEDAAPIASEPPPASQPVLAEAAAAEGLAAQEPPAEEPPVAAPAAAPDPESAPDGLGIPVPIIPTVPIAAQAPLPIAAPVVIPPASAVPPAGPLPGVPERTPPAAPAPRPEPAIADTVHVAAADIAAAQPTEATGLALVVAGRRVPLVGAATSIGRSSVCDVVIDDANASRRHAELRLRGAMVVLVDLDSTNGTAVNGRRIREQPLADGDTITIGTTRLTFERREA